MGLDCIPKPYPCKIAGKAKLTKEGKIDCDRTTWCPFRQRNFSHGVLATYCWYRGKIIARELEAIGEAELAERCYQEMSQEEALQFADELEKVKEGIERRQKVKGAGWNGHWDSQKKRYKWETYSDKQAVLEAIEEAIEWYRKVAELGCGVDTWY